MVSRGETKADLDVTVDRFGNNGINLEATLRLSRASAGTLEEDRNGTGSVHPTHKERTDGVTNE